MATTMERFQEILKPIININHDEQTSIRSLHLDQLDLNLLISDIEEEFEIQIEDEIAEKFKTVGDIIRYIDKKVAEKAKVQ